jgi:NHL repeat
MRRLSEAKWGTKGADAGQSLKRSMACVAVVLMLAACGGGGDTPAGVVSTLAGGSNTYGYSNGVGAAAVFRDTAGVAINAAGELLVTDRYNARLRKVVPVNATAR